MPIVTQQREKCIGCNYCVEFAPQHWVMSKKDGKSTLLGAVNKRGFWSVKIKDMDADANQRAADACPVKIIQVRKL